MYCDAISTVAVWLPHVYKYTIHRTRARARARVCVCGWWWVGVCESVGVCVGVGGCVGGLVDGFGWVNGRVDVYRLDCELRAVSRHLRRGRLVFVIL